MTNKEIQKELLKTLRILAVELYIANECSSGSLKRGAELRSDGRLTLFGEEEV